MFNYDFDPGKIVAFDTETTGLSTWHGCEPFAVTLCDYHGNSTYTEWPVDPYTREVFPRSEDLDFLDSVLGNPDITKVTFNGKFDMRHMEAVGVFTKGRVEDCSFGVRCYNSSADNNGLKQAAEWYCQIPKDDESALHDAVKTARRAAQSLGWRVGDNYHEDYWIPRAIALKGYGPPTWLDLNKAYCIQDGVRTMAVWRFLEMAFAEDPIIKADYENENALAPLIYKMETRGVSVSLAKNNAELEKAQTLVAASEAKMWALVGREFNPASPKQLAQLLYEERGLPIPDYTASGAPSTDWRSLLKNSADPVVLELLTHRAQSKAISTFFSKYPLQMVPDPLVPPRKCWYEGGPGKVIDKGSSLWLEECGGGHVIHPNINQTGTTSGRFSMSNPNLQNIANATTNPRGNDPIHARSIFGPRPGYVWCMADYAQQELRIFADIANVRPLIDAILEGEDPNTANANLAWGGKGNEAAVHAAVQSGEFINHQASTPKVAAMWEVIGWDAGMGVGGAWSNRVLEAAERWLALHEYKIVAAEASIGKKMTRNKSKMVMFNIIYGGGTGPLEVLLYVDKPEAARYMKAITTRYPEIRLYQDMLMKQGKEQGFIVTKYGKKLRADPNRLYALTNWMVQGTAAGQMKTAMMNCDKYLLETGLDAHVLITIHDEIIFEIRKDHLYPWVLRGIKHIMESTQGRFRLPMEVELGIADIQWDNKKGIEV